MAIVCISIRRWDGEVGIWIIEYDEVSRLFPFKRLSFHTLINRWKKKKNPRLTPIFKSKTLLCQERTNTLYYYKSNKWHFLQNQLYSCMHGLGTVTDNDELQPTRDNAKSANSNSKTNNMFGNGRREWEKKGKVRKGYHFICLVVQKEEKSEWGGVMIFPWGRLFWYQRNLCGNGKKGEN